MKRLGGEQVRPRGLPFHGEELRKIRERARRNVRARVCVCARACDCVRA